ncbi:MAG: DUF1549 and DUF1553 domain-containing protein, partial [Pirellulales bacterium]|nr:DUF1549 and DUF1553 domain-containing protein [Pirellulales bacterium]
CHDHRYDPILHTDYYRLRAVFEPAYNWKAWRSRPERLISLYTDADRAKAQEVNTQVAVVAQEREQKQSEFMAAALEKELEKFPAEQRDALRAAYQAPDDKRAPEQQKLLDDNPSLKITPGVLYQYNQAAADELKKFDARIGELQAQKPVEDFIQALTEVPGQVPPTFLFHRGDHRQPQQELPPGGLAVCSPSEAPLDFAADAEAVPTTGRRLAYARWLTSGQHPLVARVLVNRVWMHHFGQGIVGTPSDFGQMGQRPTHPELLDYLASELVAGGWRLKRLHKLMMTSVAYRQSSQIDEAKSALDPDNHLLWRYPVRRLEAEMIRDRVLAVSGALDRAMFGASVPVTQDNVGQIAVGPSPVPDAPTTVDALLGDAASRRSVYLQVRRSQPVAMLRAFDAPVMETNCDRRPSSTVSPQSLVMMNSAFLVAESRRFAWRVRLESGADRAAQIDRAWQLAYCRPPAEHERKLADDLMTHQIEELAKTPPAEGQPAPDHALTALASLCQVLMSANEFLYVE